MFVLALFSDSVAIHPSRFGDALLDALAEEIDAKYANKVRRAGGLRRRRGAPDLALRARRLPAPCRCSPVLAFA